VFEFVKTKHGWIVFCGAAPKDLVENFAPSCGPSERAPREGASRGDSQAIFGVEVTANHTSNDLLIRVKGEARVEFADALQSSLLTPAACRPAVVTLDLSELRSISSLAMGVLMSFRRGVVRAGGRVRLAEHLQPAVKEALTRAELLDVFETASRTVPVRVSVPSLRYASHPLAI
jgi:anti-anti-sigma factor